MLQGNTQAKLLIVSDFLRVGAAAEGTPLSGFHLQLLTDNLRKAGITSDDFCVTVLFPYAPYGYKDYRKISEENREEGRRQLLKNVSELNPHCIVTLGQTVTEEITGKPLSKYHSSVINSRIEYGNRKCVPCFHPEDVQSQYNLIYFLALSLSKAAEESKHPSTSIPTRKFLLNPPLNQTIEYLKDVVLKADEVSVDLETGRGQINTVGFAVSSTEAIAIGVLPERCGKEQYFNLWKVITEVCESNIPKIAQNALYEFQYFSRYGIRLNNIHHDTMWCMKFLNPELKAGLDEVGRIYTPFPYWKDDGEDWNNVRDWQAHFDYNAKDTTGTMWAYKEQEKELKERGLHALFYDHVMLYHPIIQEMWTNGLPLNTDRHQQIKAQLTHEIETEYSFLQDIFLERLGREVNPRSGQQLKKALKEMGLEIPITKGKESTDKGALIKLQKKYPKEKCFKHLLALSKKNKLMSSYVNFNYDEDLRVRYSFNGVATETGRWNCRLDPFGNGFNAQTVPKAMRIMFQTLPGHTMVQIDLAQAESRYVAWEGPEPALMELILEERDIHKYVASKIFKVSEGAVTKQQRQLGKKSGHSANYGVGPRTFAEACFIEMGLKLTTEEASRIIQGYYEVFPGIARRQKNIEKEIRTKRFLRTPLGRERVFYERMGDKIFREAYAYCPQSTIPDITNHLLIYLNEQFPSLKLLLQVHDSVVFLCPNNLVGKVVEASRDYDSWHPEIILPGGKLIIPVDIEAGENWLNLETL